MFIGLILMWAGWGLKMGAQQSKGHLGSTDLALLPLHLLPSPTPPPPPADWASCHCPK